MDRRLKVNFVPWSNFGDTLNAFFLHKENIPFMFSHHTVEHKVVMIGSIIRPASRNKTIVWGSGMIYSTDVPSVNTAIYRAVRGPETYKKLDEIGCDLSDCVLGDPALLLPRIYTPNVEKEYKLGIIPHIVDYDIYNQHIKNNPEKFKNTTLINPNTPCWRIQDFIDQVNKCEKIVSTSLHGIICAHAYGIPAIWSEIGDRLIGDGFKFKDYYCSIGAPLEKISFVVDENIDIPYIDIEIDLDALWSKRPWAADLPEKYYIDRNDEQWPTECYPEGYQDRIWDDQFFPLNK